MAKCRIGTAKFFTLLLLLYRTLAKLSDENLVTIGIWGQRHLNYLRENKRVLLSGLQISGQLNSYLADIDRQAEEMFDCLVKQTIAAEGITENLKAADQMAWGCKMNHIRNRATEIVYADIIYT